MLRSFPLFLQQEVQPPFLEMCDLYETISQRPR